MTQQPTQEAFIKGEATQKDSVKVYYHKIYGKIKVHKDEKGSIHGYPTK